MLRLFCFALTLALGSSVSAQSYRYWYWLYFYGYGGASVPLAPGPHATLQSDDVYPGVGEDELRVIHHTTYQAEDYCTAPLTRDLARALAHSSACLIADPCYGTTAADGDFTLRVSFTSDALGGSTVHTGSLTMNGIGSGFYAIQVNTADYPAMAALLTAYAAGEGTHLEVSFNNGGTNFRDVDFGFYNIRIESEVLTPAFLADNPLSIVPEGASMWKLVLPKSAGYTPYILEESSDLTNWGELETKNELWGPLTWTVPRSAGPRFYRVRVGTPH